MNKALIYYFFSYLTVSESSWRTGWLVSFSLIAHGSALLALCRQAKVASGLLRDRTIPGFSRVIGKGDGSIFCGFPSEVVNWFKSG
ncbi:MAG: hypothetical protein M1508_08745 [Nitrospirae bacterium]|nr:hypothetical protein [Nitrospirota bacterium]